MLIRTGQIRRTWLVAAFFAGLLIYALIIGALWVKHAEQMHEAVRLNAENRAIALQHDIEESRQVTEVLKMLIEAEGSGALPNFAKRAEALMEARNYIASLQLAPRGMVTEIYPLEGNEAGLIDLFADEVRGRIVSYSRDTGKTTMQGPFPLKQGGMGIAVRNPVYLPDASGNRTFWGFTIAIIRVPDIFRDTVATLRMFGYEYALYKANPLARDMLLVSSSTTQMIEPDSLTFEAGGVPWRIDIMPAGGWQVTRTILPHIVIGLVLVMLFTLLSYLVVLLAEDRALFSQMSMKDLLTGLDNSRSFNIQWDEIRRERSPYGLFYIDVNRFKQVNDTYGHSVGNDVLKEVAQRLQTAVSFPVFRLEGDEFAVLAAAKLSRKDCDTILVKIDRAFETPVVSGELQLSVTLSTGYARYPDDAEDPQRLREMADKRMYEQKKRRHAREACEEERESS